MKSYNTYTWQEEREAEQDNICSALDNLIKRQRKLSFTDPSKSTDLEGLGILVSRYNEWDGEGVYLVAYEALTDANYHALAAKLKYLWDHPFVRAEQLCAAEDARTQFNQAEDARITKLTEAEDEASEKAIREVFHIPHMPRPPHSGEQTDD